MMTAENYSAESACALKKSYLNIYYYYVLIKIYTQL